MHADRRGGENSPLEATRLPDAGALTTLGRGRATAESSGVTSGLGEYSARNWAGGGTDQFSNIL